MISEGWCDTEDWGNDAEYSAFITGISYIWKYIQKKKKTVKFNFNIFF